MIEMKSESYISGGARLSYIESGSGVPILFLHPTPLDHFYWLPLLKVLPNLRAVVLDLRAHGASELGTGLPVGGFARVPNAPTLTMAQLADDTLILLDRLGLHEAVFVGCSIGGYVMLEIWRRAPRRMRGLAFICSKPQPDAEPNFIKRADTIAKARAGETEALFDGMAQASISATAKTRRPAIVPELRARMTLTADSIVAVQAGLAARPDSTHRRHHHRAHLRCRRRRRSLRLSRRDGRLPRRSRRMRFSSASRCRPLRGLRTTRHRCDVAYTVAQAVWRICAHPA